MKLKFPSIGKKTKSAVNARRVEMERMQRFNPLRMLSPEYIVSAHEEFRAGRLRNAAKLWEAVSRTDDVCCVAEPKRKKAVSRHGYEIIKDDDSPEAESHAAALQFFYDQLRATRCDDRNVRGGVPLLIRQMMDAEGKYYAIHEIVWKPIDGGLTAEMIFVPLWYFENTSGELRLLEGLSDMEGAELPPGEWLTNSGQGLMEACTVAYMFKHMPLQDWLLYSENFGMPIPIGSSPDQPDSKGWNALVDAVTSVGRAQAAVISSNASIDIKETQGAQSLPYGPLVERMDRAIASLWRGADLSTISKGDGTGASLQADETELLEDDDAANITDVLNEQLDRFVILYACGSTTPKAWVKIKGNVREDVQQDLSVDKGLHEMGYEDSLDSLKRRYNRQDLEPRAGADQSIPAANERRDELDSLQKNSRAVIAAAIALDLRPVAASLADLMDNTPDELLANELQAWQRNTLPGLLVETIADPTSTRPFEDTLRAAGMNGYFEEVAAHA